MSPTIYDVIIVGAGPAGLAAGIYASRRALVTLILSSNLGGQAATTFEIENYPGFDLIDGLTLTTKFAKQAQKFGAQIKYSEVKGIFKNGKNFMVRAATEEYQARSIILAFGLEHRSLAVPGEKEFTGRGVSYCAVCDGPLFKGKVVAVVGGGSAAFDAADYLAKLAKKVYLIHRRDKFSCEECLVNQVKNNSKIEILMNSGVKEIIGDQVVDAIVLKNEKEEKIKVSGVFIEIGSMPHTEVVKGLIKLNKKGEIITNKDAETSVPGIFAAGDVTDGSFKQVVISAGEGAKAALQAYKYLKLKDGEKVLPDWNRKK